MPSVEGAAAMAAIDDAAPEGGRARVDDEPAGVDEPATTAVVGEKRPRLEEEPATTRPDPDPSPSSRDAGKAVVPSPLDEEATEDGAPPLPPAGASQGDGGAARGEEVAAAEEDAVRDDALSAFVAREWRELLTSDITGRLGAARRSKGRVQRARRQQRKAAASSASPSDPAAPAPCLPAHLHAQADRLFAAMEATLEDEVAELERWKEKVFAASSDAPEPTPTPGAPPPEAPAVAAA